MIIYNVLVAIINHGITIHVKPPAVLSIHAAK